MRSDFEFEDLFLTRQDRQSTLQRPPFEGKPLLLFGICGVGFGIEMGSWSKICKNIPLNPFLILRSLMVSS